MNTLSSTVCRSVYCPAEGKRVCVRVRLFTCFPSPGRQSLLQRWRHHPDCHLWPRLLLLWSPQPAAAGGGDWDPGPGRSSRRHKSVGGVGECRHGNSGANDEWLQWHRQSRSFCFSSHVVCMLLIRKASVSIVLFLLRNKGVDKIIEASFVD